MRKEEEKTGEWASSEGVRRRPQSDEHPPGTVSEALADRCGGGTEGAEVDLVLAQHGHEERHAVLHVRVAAAGAEPVLEAVQRHALRLHPANTRTASAIHSHTAEGALVSLPLQQQGERVQLAHHVAQLGGQLAAQLEVLAQHAQPHRQRAHSHRIGRRGASEARWFDTAQHCTAQYSTGTVSCTAQPQSKSRVEVKSKVEAAQRERRSDEVHLSRGFS